MGEFEKAMAAEKCDRYMYSFSPISEEAKEWYNTRCIYFEQGAVWARKWLQSAIDPAIKYAEEIKINNLILRTENQRLKEALRKVVSQNRTKGYPTGQGWDFLCDIAGKALK